MESQQSGSRRSSATSRRETRSTRAARPQQPSFVARWVPRLSVLAALGAATIAVPVLDAAADEGSAQSTGAAIALQGPSTYEVLSASSDAVSPTTILAPIPQASRTAEVVSRSLERDPLPGCDGEAGPATVNGQIPASDLCELWISGQLLRGDAAVALSQLNESYRVVFGRNLCMTDSYRSYSEQQRLAWIKPGLAAVPGRSNHGWGLAIDLCGYEQNNGAVMDWLFQNGPIFGWVNPDWAQPGGSGAYEPWHWEYKPGTDALGTSY